MSKSRFPEYPILIIDDEMEALQSLEITLNSAGIDHIDLCNDSRDVLPLIDKKNLSFCCWI